MTVGMFTDRLERFRQGVLLYREMCQRDTLHSHSGSDSMSSSSLEPLRDKLREQFSFLDEYVTTFSQGRYHIHLDSRGLQDIYAHALSEECREWHLDAILSDLEHMLAELRRRPLDQPLSLDNPWKDGQGATSQHSFGSLGHLGHSFTPNTPATLHAVLRMVANIIQQRINGPEDKAKLQTHLQALVDHPEMAALLPLSPSQLL